ncbi:MAG: hypothetical protein ACJ77E_11995 [Gaiellaceae bacterium]
MKVQPSISIPIRTALAALAAAAACLLAQTAGAATSAVAPALESPPEQHQICRYEYIGCLVHPASRVVRHKTPLRGNRPMPVRRLIW